MRSDRIVVSPRAVMMSPGVMRPVLPGLSEVRLFVIVSLPSLGLCILRAPGGLECDTRPADVTLQGS